MTVSRIELDGYKNLSGVKITLDKHANVISGKNGAGKTSVIEGMMDALLGKTEMGKVPQRKIKKGEASAVIEVTLDTDDGELVVQRKITAKDVYLKAHRSDGTKVTQTDLSNLLDKTTINITKLLFMKPEEQVNFIKSVAGINTEEVEERYRDLYAERTVLNRELKQAKAVLDSKPEPEEVERVDVSELQKELSEAMLHNQEADKKTNEMNAKKMRIESIEARVSAGEDEIKQLQDRIAEIKEKNKERKAEITKIKKEVKSFFSRNEVLYRDVTVLNEQITSAAVTNELAAVYEDYVKAKQDVADAEERVNEVNTKMKDALQEREDLIANGRLPFKNIGLDKDLGLTISGIPFSEMSTAQKIRVMSRIYIESNPRLKVIYIQDGSLLDEDTLAQITEMSDMKDFQFLIEVVEEHDGDIVMREGRVISGDDVEDEDVEEL
jgi:DNA repair exonuclease SbcCD ATPase subunit